MFDLFFTRRHKVYLYTYDEVLNIPDGVEVLDANLILPKEKIFTYGSVTGKGKGNHFRYEMLLKCSNTYLIDMIVICLSPFYIDYGFENESYINNAVISTKKAGNKLFANLSKCCNNSFVFTRYDTYKFLIRKLKGRTCGRGIFLFTLGVATDPKALTGIVKTSRTLKIFSINRQI